MGVETLIKMIVALIGEYLFKPEKAAKYAKWFLRARDYLLLLFPLDVYPEQGLLESSSFSGMTREKVAVPIAAVKEAAKSRGFNIPFIKGI